MHVPVVLFDLDGTVIDSAAIILASMRHAASTVPGREFTDEELMASVGGPGLEAQMAALDPTRVEELVRMYRAHNEPLHDELEVFLGMERVLEALQSEGRRLGIVTAKRRVTVEMAFARLPLARFFEVIVGGDETERHKPDPEPLLLALSRLTVTAADAAYVGDSPYDIRAAKAAGMYAVAVTWGRIHGRAALELERPDAIAESAQELLGILS
jgi:pyrophosphatase PpaX